MRGAPSLGAPRGSSSRRIHIAALRTKGTLMKRRIALLAVAAAPTAIALIAAAFVSFASGSLSSPGPYRPTATASAPSGAASAASVDTPNSPPGKRPPTASAVTSHQGEGVRRPVERCGHLVNGLDVVPGEYFRPDRQLRGRPEIALRAASNGSGNPASSVRESARNSLRWQSGCVRALNSSPEQ